jgi:hypothetical protein
LAFGIVGDPGLIHDINEDLISSQHGRYTPNYMCSH